MEMEVNHFSKVLQTHLVDVTSNLALMLDFSCGIEGVPTIDLTKDKAVVQYPLPKGNIADNHEDNLEVPTIAPGPSNHQQTVQDESFRSAAFPHTDSDAAPGTSSASALRIIPTTSLATDKQHFSPQSIGRLKALMSKENRTQTLIKVGAEEASTHFDAHVSQDEASYDVMVVCEVDDTQIEGSKPVEADTVADQEVPEATTKEDGSQTSKSADKKPAHQHSNRASSRTQDCPVCYDRDILTDGHKDKYPKDYISIHCVQRAGRVLLMSCFGILKEEQKMSNIFFHPDITLVDDQLCRAVSGQVYPGTQTHQKLELPYEIYLGSLEFIWDSFQEFMPCRASCIQVDCTLVTTLSFKGQVI